MEKRINIEECYFHGLAGGIPFWDEERVSAVGMRQLRQIIKSKGIYSRKILKEKYGINIDEEQGYNGEEYISLCKRHAEESEFYGEFSYLDPAFYRYIKYKMGIAISPDIINTCNFREDGYKRLPGERQVKDSIDISNFIAIVIGLSNKAKAIKELEEILKNTGIPIIDIEGNILTSEGTKSMESLDIEK